MALIGGRKSKKRPQYVTGTLQSAATQHGTVMKVWPRKRGRPRSQLEAFRMARLAMSVTNLKDMTTDELAGWKDAIAAFNEQNSGLRGDSRIRFEDWLTMWMLGPKFVIDLEDGRTLVPINIRMEVSALLDWLQPLHGSIITRTPKAWLCTDHGLPGQLFYSMLEGEYCGRQRDARLWQQPEVAQTFPMPSNP